MAYNWTLLYRAPGGHKYYRDEVSGRVAVADQSGTTPDTTEDGVLWLRSEPFVVQDEDYVSVPLTDERGRSVMTGATMVEAQRAAALVGQPVVYKRGATVYLNGHDLYLAVRGLRALGTAEAVNLAISLEGALP